MNHYLDLSSEAFPLWVKEFKPWEQGWFPILLVKEAQGWEENSLLDIIHSYVDTSLESIVISENRLLLLVSNKTFQFDPTHTNEITEFAFGLHDMLQTEWHEEIKIGIDQPAPQLGELLHRSRQLLEDGEWVRWMWDEIDIFSPWDHFLERLISLIPVDSLENLLEQQWSLDPEIEETVRIFLAENLNMSETARRLFIHRNTLQYRIDKVKQITGLDVKHFENAVLYKVKSLLLKRIGQNVQKHE
ncbi:helix-turn-helix domain-containing protein [Tepidibacillus marianensis]|uniref:PucR family transcriptional regulator n=1 Tax=Tepidibacillus marianensis TaxID=3131995 RepID=UPI0030CD23B2